MQILLFLMYVHTMINLYACKEEATLILDTIILSYSKSARTFNAFFISFAPIVTSNPSTGAFFTILAKFNMLKCINDNEMDESFMGALCLMKESANSGCEDAIRFMQAINIDGINQIIQD